MWNVFMPSISMSLTVASRYLKPLKGNFCTPSLCMLKLDGYNILI